MKKIWIFIAISGALAVIMGAMSAHLLKDSLTPEEITRIQTAANYQIIHTLMIAILSVLHAQNPLKAILHSRYLFIIGMVLFSGSLYAYTFSHIHALVFITPIGGMLLILAWLSLIRLAFIKRRQA